MSILKLYLAKISKNLGILRRVAHIMPSSIILTLYHTLINLYLQYGNIVWAATYSTRLNCLILLQKRAIRIVAKDSYCAHTWPRFQEYNIMKFDRVNNYHVGIFMYRYLYFT